MTTPAQLKRFWSIASDFEHSRVQWAGQRWCKEDWGTILKSGHKAYTRQYTRVIKGLEDEPLEMRVSLKKMDRSEAADLISYAESVAVEMNVPLRDPEGAALMESV